MNDEPVPQPTNSSGGLVDILNQLDPNRRNEMVGLISRYKSGTLTMPDFMTRSREILGDRLYEQFARDMNKAAQAQAQQRQLPPMRPPPPAFHPPQIMYPPPSMMSSQYYPPPMPAAAPMMAAPAEVDVSKMDSSSLQDVIQYSGVDLKAEAEALYREHEAAHLMNQTYVDHRLKVDYFFNPMKMRAILQSRLQRHYLQTRSDASLAASSSSSGQSAAPKPLGLSEDALQLLGLALQKRLIGIIRRLSEVSKHRVDFGRGKFKIKIENDPKKQLWLLEKLFIEGVAEGANAKAPENTTIASVPSMQTVKANAASVSGSGNVKEKESTAKEAAQPKPEDLSIKTKLANVTAMAALGIRQKSWMSGAAAAAPEMKAEGTSAAKESKDQDTMDVSGKSDDAETAHPLSAFYSLPSVTPLSDTDLRSVYQNRICSVVDLITCMEADPHLCRSKLLAVLYEALPRENKRQE